MKDKAVMLCLLAMLVGGICILESNIVKMRPSAPDSNSDSSVYMLAGEFRTVFANLLWVKAEQYHHEYIANHPDWTQNKELLGLIQLITKLDPEFPEAYAVGTYIYADGCKNNKAAIKYVCEGIKNNPKSWDLDRVAAIIYARRMNDPQSAIPYAQLAVNNCDDDWYRIRMHWLLNSVERMAREKKLANQPRALPQQ